MAFGIVNAVPHKANEGYIKTSEKNAANGVAGLDASGKLPAARIPAHDNANTTYGAGSGSKYGHVKLSDATDGTSGANGGVAATPAAVKAIADALANKAAKNHGHAAADISDLSTVVQSLVSGAAKIQAGSYTGTGTYGASNPCSLTFDFVPHILILVYPGYADYDNTSVDEGKSIIWISGIGLVVTYVGNSSSVGQYYIESVRFTLSGKTLSWSSDKSESIQFNRRETKYYYTAIS